MVLDRATLGFIRQVDMGLSENDIGLKNITIWDMGRQDKLQRHAIFVFIIQAIYAYWHTYREKRKCELYR